jgi:hypothetical protein
MFRLQFMLADAQRSQLSCRRMYGISVSVSLTRRLAARHNPNDSRNRRGSMLKLTSGILAINPGKREKAPIP